MRSALIVEDGREAYVLAAARSLAAAGWRVGLAGPMPNVRAAASRAVDRWDEVPPPSSPDFAAAVARVVDTRGYDLVFGGDDAEVLALSAARESVRATFPYASHDVVVAVIDKSGIGAAAEAVGLRAPATRPATDDALRGLTAPVVVKAGLHWQPGTAGEGRFPAVVAADGDTARRRVAEIRAGGCEPLLQDVVAGDLHAISLLVGHDGRTIGVTQQRSLRLTPGRTSARAVTVPVDADLLGRVERMAANAGWRGLLNLQFLVDVAAERYVIDVNGRFYGSLALARAAGVDFPRLWAEDWAGAPPARRYVGRAGVRWQTLDGDLLRARTSERGRAAEVAGSLAFAARASHTTPSWRDPMPVVRWYAARATRRLRRGR